MKKFNLNLHLAFLLFLTSGQSAQALPERIVTLAPNLAEWVAEIVGKEETLKHVVGVSEYSDYPSWVKSIESIGPYPRINVEKILKLNPTLILALDGSNDEAQLKQLERLKIKVVRMPQERFSGMKKWIQKLGAALDEHKGGAVAASRWQGKVQRISLKMSKIKLSKRNLFIEVQDEPMVTVGGTSFLSDAFKLIGYQNIFSNLTQSYPKVSRESVIASNPTHIFIIDLTGSESAFEAVRNKWRKFKNISAVEHDQIILLKGDDFGRCSFRLLGALENLI